MQGTQPPDAAAEIEFVKSIVARYFSVYETRPSLDAIYFMCNVDKNTLDDNFKMLHQELGRSGYTPVITFQKGEYLVIVGKMPKQKFRGIWVNVVMLILTLLTTIFVGTLYWQGYAGDMNANPFTPEYLLMGTLTFALPIMAILGIHEMGHYFTARKLGVPASLPFFIPYPFAIGTLGAFISIRGPIPDRKTMFYLGIAGPIFGFLATIPVAIAGLMLTNQAAVPPPEAIGGMSGITIPLIYEALAYLFPITGDFVMHPMAFAGWVGFFLTAINLLPAGSLDGGHIARAIFGPRAQLVSYAAVFGLFILSWFYMGWIFFAILILFLGMGHSPPLNDITPLKSKQKMLAVGAGIMLVVSFVLVPFYSIPEDHSFTAELQGGDSAILAFGTNHTFEITLSNTGNSDTSVVFDFLPDSAKTRLSATTMFFNSTSGENQTAHSNAVVFLPVNRTVSTFVNFRAIEAVTSNLQLNITLLMETRDYSDFNRTILLNITLVPVGSSTTSVQIESSKPVLHEDVPMLGTVPLVRSSQVSRCF